MKRSFFSICEVRDAAKVLGVPAGGEAYDMLNQLHCVHWADMPLEIRKVVPELIREVLSIEPMPLFTTEPTSKPTIDLADFVTDVTPVHVPFWKRLPWK